MRMSVLRLVTVHVVNIKSLCSFLIRFTAAARTLRVRQLIVRMWHAAVTRTAVFRVLITEHIHTYHFQGCQDCGWFWSQMREWGYWEKADRPTVRFGLRWPLLTNIHIKNIFHNVHKLAVWSPFSICDWWFWTGESVKMRMWCVTSSMRATWHACALCAWHNDCFRFWLVRTWFIYFPSIVCVKSSRTHMSSIGSCR